MADAEILRFPTRAKWCKNNIVRFCLRRSVEMFGTAFCSEGLPASGRGGKKNALPQPSPQAKPNKPQVRDFAGKTGGIPV
jgi:hypothetical protein